MVEEVNTGNQYQQDTLTTFGQNTKQMKSLIVLPNRDFVEPSKATEYSRAAPFMTQEIGEQIVDSSFEIAETNKSDFGGGPEARQNLLKLFPRNKAYYK